MRPKSSATVVVVLVDEAPSSMPTATDVMAASVDSGAISEMEPTNVVLPTPKPPAITIFTGVGGAGGAAGFGSWRTRRPRRSEGPQAVEHSFQQGHVLGGVGA